MHSYLLIPVLLLSGCTSISLAETDSSTIVITTGVNVKAPEKVEKPESKPEPEPK